MLRTVLSSFKPTKKENNVHIKKLSILSLCLGFNLLGGCASIVNGTSQSLSVVTQPKGATCSLQNNKGKWFVNNTPGSVTVHKSFHNLQVQCQKKGFKPANLSVTSKVKPMVFGNVLFGGVIGAGVDVGDGAAYYYPPLINVPKMMKR